jgi:hypothetical protein
LNLLTSMINDYFLRIWYKGTEKSIILMMWRWWKLLRKPELLWCCFADPPGFPMFRGLKPQMVTTVRLPTHFNCNWAIAKLHTVTGTNSSGTGNTTINIDVVRDLKSNNFTIETTGENCEKMGK